MRQGMVIDLKRCIGCYGCQVACKAEHGTPPGVFRARVLKQEIGEYPTVSLISLPVLCNHCSEPPCVDACPTGASFVWEDTGAVDIDADKCVGCRSCMMACPYSNRYFVPERLNYYGDKGPTVFEQYWNERSEVGIVTKCNFCRDRVLGRQGAGLRRQLSDGGAVFRRSRRPHEQGVAADQGARRFRRCIRKRAPGRTSIIFRRDAEQERERWQADRSDTNSFSPISRPSTARNGNGRRARGLFLIVGHFLVGVAGGAWVYGQVLDDTPCLVAAFVLGAAGGLAHLVNLGRPERFWRMMVRVRTSWVARGFWGLSLFLLGSVLYLPPLLWPAWAWPAGSLLAGAGVALAWVGAVVMIGYMGFAYMVSKGIPFWNSSLHPVLYITYALRGGAGAVLVLAPFFGQPMGSATGLLQSWIAITAAVILLWGVEIVTVLSSGDDAAR